MKKTDLSSLDVHFRKIYDNIDLLLEEIDNSLIPSRVELIRELFLEQLEKLNFSDIISASSSASTSLKEGERTAETDYDKILNLIDEIEENPVSKEKKIEDILSMITGMSKNDKAVLKSTFANLEVAQLKTAFKDIFSAFNFKD